MTSSIFQALLLLASARQAFASCAYGTFLKPRAEEGDVPISKFGYTGLIVISFPDSDLINSSPADARYRVRRTGPRLMPPMEPA